MMRDYERFKAITTKVADALGIDDAVRDDILDEFRNDFIRAARLKIVVRKHLKEYAARRGGIFFGADPFEDFEAVFPVVDAIFPAIQAELPHTAVGEARVMVIEIYNDEMNGDR
jgi:hypothetical protein